VVNKRLPILLQLISMFGVTILLLLGVLSFSLFQYTNITEGFNTLISHTATRALIINHAHTDFTRALLDMRGFLIYADGAAYVHGYRDNINNSYQEVKKFRESSTLEDTKRESKKLETLLAEYITLGERVIAAKKANDPNLSNITAEGRRLVKEIDTQFMSVSDLQQNKYLYGKAKTLMEQTKRDIKISIVVSMAVLIAVIGIALWYSRNLTRRLTDVKNELVEIGNLNLTTPDVLTTRNDEIGDMGLVIIDMKKSLRRIVRQLQTSADTLAASGEELSATVEEQMRAVETISQSVQGIAAGASQNVDHISGISAALEEISAGAEEISATATEVNTNTQNAVTEADKGMSLLGEVVNQNQTIGQAMAEITAVTAELAKGSESIKGIVDVINGIAGQTNLLALNAAIEAARAGEQGRGFAVVAEEVRKLAEQSQSATENIQEIIFNMAGAMDTAIRTVEKANEEVTRGKTSAENTRKGFEEIVGKLGVVRTGIEQISHAVNETARGTQNMVQSVNEIGTVAGKTSASTETVAAASEQQAASMHEIQSNADSLATIASELNAIARRFRA
jgi:methyl-accepting chemotaxis protein